VPEVHPLTGADTETELGVDQSDAPTRAHEAVTDLEQPARHVRVFGSHAFFRLWLAQVVSATGDWLGLIAITALAASLGSGSEGVAIGLVLAARVGPGFFLAPVAGVFADRLDRRKLMVSCDVGRAAVLACLPFVDSVAALVLASLVLEVFTLLWTPAKEATVPNLVPPERLASTNSLSLVAAYGTFPIGAALFALLSRVASLLSDAPFIDALRLNQEGLAFFVDAGTFLVAAAIVWSLDIPSRSKRERDSSRRVEIGHALRDVKEGWQFAFIDPTVRAVVLGLATGLVGGGMLVPLGAVFSNVVLGAGEAGFGLLVLALGLGVGSGVLTISLLQTRLDKRRLFTEAVLAAGVLLLVAATLSSLHLVVLLVGLLGVCAGVIYVLGFTLLHESVDDDLRGRTFGALYTMVRLCVLLALLIGPLLSEVLDGASSALVDREVSVAGVSLFLPGVRLTLWLAGLVIIGAGIIAAASFRAADRERQEASR
jgi:dTMP kinase